LTKEKFIPHLQYSKKTDRLMLKNSDEFYNLMSSRRTVREFDSKLVPKEIIENCIKTAGTAPSGANLQPWTFVAVQDQNIKSSIRAAAEEEEKSFYGGKAPKDWLNALAHLGTDEYKPFLETAPWLIAVFAQKHGGVVNGNPKKHYYVTESVGIATGMLITALHQAGLVSLTHTPSPMKFLNQILKRPDNEKPFLLLVTGYPAEDCVIPDIKRKPLTEIAEFI